MAQRDYVKKKNRSSTNNSRVMPRLMMAIALLLVILFVAILYFVSNNKSTKPPAKPITKTETPEVTLPEQPNERWTYLKELENPDGVTTSQGQTNQLTSAQELERKAILDSFVGNSSQPRQPTNNTTSSVENQSQVKQETSVTQPASSTASSSNQAILLQCGAFKDKTNAEALKAKLAMTGVSSDIRSEKFYRVLAGPYSSKREADKAIADLKSNNIANCIITAK